MTPRIAFARFIRDPGAMIAALLLLALVAMAVLAPFLAPQNPYDPMQIDIMDSELPPVWVSGGEERFLFGTDTQGRGILSTVMYGMGVSLMIGVGAVFVQAFLGITFGMLAGYFGGWIDSFLMRLADIQLSLSTLMVAIIALAIFQAALGASAYADNAIWMLILVIGIAEWPQYARTVRANVLVEKKKEYVDAARLTGMPARRIMVRHILPNAIVSEAALSFLGLGMPVNRPSLGSLIRSGFENVFSGQWWITAIPAIVLVLLILAINLLGDWLRDTLNPKLYKGH
jgi:peptide/nickel transport system permease protein